MGKYFGTDGFRGKAGEALKAAHAYRIGRYLGWYFAKGKENSRAKILIGKDTRRSSYMFENALAAGICASGSDAYLMHVTTTPSVSYITADEGFDCGIMISASHNPFYDNGIKLLNGRGEKMEDSVTKAIEDFIDSPDESLPFACEERIGKCEDYYFGRNKYIGHLSRAAEKSFENCKVGIDCANGSAWMIGRAVFDALGAKTHLINNSPNGLNENCKCGSTHPEALAEFVKSEALDVGFAFDGDADRCICVDENGNIISGDQIMYVCAKYLKENGKIPNDKIVVTVMSNIGLIKALEKIGISCEITGVGDKLVYEGMMKTGAAFGGEQSGHIIFGDLAHTGDGILTAIMVMNVMINTQLPLSILASGCVMYPQVLKNVSVDDKEATLEEPRVKEEVKKCEQILAGSGRVLLRASGTEPVLRVMAEAKTREEALKAVDSLIAAMAESGHLIEIRK